MTPELKLNLFLFALGCALGWVVTRFYALRASRELERISQAFARIAEDQGLVEWTRDTKGRITFGRAIRLSVEAAELVARGAKIDGQGTVTPAERE